MPTEGLISRFAFRHGRRISLHFRLMPMRLVLAVEARTTATTRRTNSSGCYRAARATALLYAEGESRDQPLRWHAASEGDSRVPRMAVVPVFLPPDSCH